VKGVMTKRKRNWKDGYKVVLVSRSGELLSATIGKADGGCVTYCPGVETVPLPKCGPLCVFTSFEYADKFRGIPHQIWRCKYKPTQKTCVWLSDLLTALSIEDLPDGTALADAVVLTEKVSDDEIQKAKEEL